MSLTQDGQVMVRGLVMGPGTDYIIDSFNPYSRITRAPYSGEDPYGDGGYSGPEWLEPVQIPLSVHVAGDNPSRWWELHTQLLQALRPIRDEPLEPELHWRVGEQDFMMFARPRVLDANIRNLRTGDVTNSCSLLALDPSTYSGGENGLHSVELKQVGSTGGISAPVSAPVYVHSVVTEGRAEITNAGIEPTSMYLRIYGPVVQPKIMVVAPGGLVYTFWIDITLTDSQWVLVDTAAEEVLLNGTSTRLSDAKGSFPLLYPGTSTVEFRAGALSPDARAVIEWRDRW